MGCRRARPAQQLFRVGRSATGTLIVSRAHPGRGAWLCGDDPRCVDLAIRRRGFDRAFKAPVRGIDAEALRSAVAL